MCTILLQSETLPAEKRSRKASQAEVDKLMEYDRKLSEAFTKEELLNSDYISGSRSSSGHIYVWLDAGCYCESKKKGFYYVRYHNSIFKYHGFGCYSTAYAHPVLVVQKSKLRPDQIEFMERLRQETIADAQKCEK